MKTLKTKGITRYIVMALISLLVSVTLLASEQHQEKEAIIEQDKNILEGEIESMGTQIDDLQQEIDKMRTYINTLEEYRKQVYIITKDTPVFKETSSNSKKLGTLPVNSVVSVTWRSKDGIWYECQYGYFKCYNAIALINAQETSTFIVEEEKTVVSTQPSEDNKNKTIVDASKSIIGKSNLTVQQVEQLLAGSPMSGCGPAVLEVESKYNINAFFTVSVAQAETQRGKTGTGASKKNPYGLTQKGGGYRTFKSYNEAIMTFGDTLNRLYIPNGRTTIEKVNEIYCPGNSQWSVNVRTIMKNYKTKLM